MNKISEDRPPKGMARHPGRSTQDILADDLVKVDPKIGAPSYRFLGDEDIPVERYLSADFAKLEYERLWNRTWQWACREEHIPEVGDYIVYDIGPYSFIVTRTAPGTIKAYYNACLHRGTKLRASGSAGRANDFRCSFHGWSWNTDGTLKNIPCRWDFPHVEDDAFRLPEAKVECWCGFVFINMDPKAKPLAEHLGKEIVEQFSGWDFAERYSAVHIIKRLPCNWKLAMEAFLESYHVIETHPKTAISTGDANTQYDIWGQNVSRFLAPMGVLSPHLEGKFTEQDILDTFVLGDRTVLGDRLMVPKGGTARQVMATELRKIMQTALKTDLSKFSDSEMIDAYSYSVFPNLFLWPGISLPLIYRFRPDPKDHTNSFYEVLMLRQPPKGEPRPAPAEPFCLDIKDSYTTVPGMDPNFGAILDEDTNNVGLQQEGIAASKKRGLTLGNYQEIRIRQFEQAIDKYVGKP